VFPIEVVAVAPPCVAEGKVLVLDDDDPPGIDCIIMPGILHPCIDVPCPITVVVPFMFIITGTIIMTCCFCCEPPDITADMPIDVKDVAFIFPLFPLMLFAIILFVLIVLLIVLPLLLLLLLLFIPMLLTLFMLLLLVLTPTLKLGLVMPRCGRGIW